MKRIIHIDSIKNKYIKQINEIFISSFPIEERYIDVNDMIKKKNTNLYSLIEDNKAIGMIYLIEHRDMIFILYIAVDSNIRSEGNGSFILNWCLNEYKSKKIFLNVDEVNIDFEDYKIRKKRLDFYLKNGFYLTEYISKEDTKNFNILANTNYINVNEYIELDKIVAEILDEPISIIEKI